MRRQDLFIGQAEFKPGEPVPEHRHVNPIFLLVAHGAFVADTPLGEFTSPSLSVLVEPQGEPSDIRISPSGLGVIVVECGPEWLDSHAISLTSTSGLVDTSVESRLTILRISQMLGVPECEESLEETVLEMVLRNSDQCNDPELPWLRSAKLYVDEHCTESITLRTVAAEIGVHPTHLARVFRRWHGCSIGEYIAKARVLAGAKLLFETGSSAAEAAHEAGFFDQAHFTRTCRHLIGSTPGKLRSLLSQYKKIPCNRDVTG